MGSRKIVVLVCALALLAGGPASGATKMKVLGEDVVGDAAPALDLTHLAVGRAGPDLEIHIGVDGMFPQVGGYPQVPGIQWAFVVRGRTFIAEAYVDGRRPYFLLFEDHGDSFEQLGQLEGTYDAADGFIRLLVPLKMVKARKGTKIRGAPGGQDVDAHLHIGPQTHYADTMETTKAFVVR